MNVSKSDLRYLRLLSETYPSKISAATEIINLSAIQNLPKGTEHFLSDIRHAGRYRDGCKATTAKSAFLNPCNTFRDRRVAQIAAALERMVTDGLETFWEDNAPKACAAVEHEPADGHQAVGEPHVRQRRATVERAILNLSDAFGNHNTLERFAL